MSDGASAPWSGVRAAVRLVLGRPLANHEQGEQKIGVLAGIPALGLDALASSAYGPEALLTVLMPLGAAGIGYVRPLTAIILALLAIVSISYRQTISAYPQGAGSYTVAKENLGVHAGLIAAAALMIDYVLNVAVAISAGVAALVSAIPALHPYMLPLCLGVLIIIALVNLRGTVEAGWAFAIPTYLFVACFAVVIATGFWTGLEPGTAAPSQNVATETGTVTLWMLLHAFASGCTAMTGVEAVSNGITVFRQPAVLHAERTLTSIAIILGVLLGGVAWLCGTFQIGAMDQNQPGYQSVLSQLLAATIGRGTFYYIAMTALLSVLVLSANTSFVDFPRLCRALATDSYLPHAFTLVGRRLVYSVGIGFLTVTAGLLLILVRGITDQLIPLFAVGAFLAFTLSQAGMVVHWQREGRQTKDRGITPVKLGINATGAIATATALAVILAAKFTEGAWITILALPALFVTFKAIRQHYYLVEIRIAKREPIQMSDNPAPVVVLPIDSWNKLTEKSLRFALSLSSDVVAVHLVALEGSEADENSKKLEQEWSEDVQEPVRRAGVKPPQLKVIYSPYRRFVEPLMQFIEQLEQQHQDRPVAVLIPKVVKQHWWQFLLHHYRVESLARSLLRKGDPRLIVTTIPWYLDPVAR